jgi:hypothetical protein
MTCCRQSLYIWSSTGSGLICQSLSVALAHQQHYSVFSLQMECEFLLTEEMILVCCAPKMSWTVMRTETTCCVRGRYFNRLLFSLKRQLRSWQLLTELYNTAPCFLTSALCPVAEHVPSFPLNTSHKLTTIPYKETDWYLSYRHHIMQSVVQLGSHTLHKLKTVQILRC